jgi:aminopeptidase YwaD
MFKSILIIFLSLPVLGFSQDREYARKVIDTLTSSFFWGRGALDSGERKAAEFIQQEFEKQGLKAFNQNHFQEFLSPINVFPGELSLEIGGKQLRVGQDYLIDPSAKGVKGSFQMEWCAIKNGPSEKKLKKLAQENYFKNKFIVIDAAGVTKDNPVFKLLTQNKLNAKGLIFIKDKLTHSLSSKLNNFTTIFIQRGVINEFDQHIKLKINQKFLNNYHSQNVIGYIEGSQHPDSIIILSAHYDHLGKLGDEVFFPGANDNASGVALLLNLAAHYSAKEKPSKTLVFIAFGAEEIGLVGSKYFIDHPLVDLGMINFVFNMDLMGTGSKGAMLVNGSVFKTHFEKIATINEKQHYLIALKKRGAAANSDHYWFSEKGIPAFFIYLMGGIKAYHDIYDISETLPLTEFEDSFRLIRDFVDDL